MHKPFLQMLTHCDNNTQLFHKQLPAGIGYQLKSVVNPIIFLSGTF